MYTHKQYECWKTKLCNWNHNVLKVPVTTNFSYKTLFYVTYLAYSDLKASSSILSEFDPYPGSTVYFPIFVELPPPPLSGSDHVFWHGPSPCLHNITAVIKTCRACFVLICFCHSVFLGISSPGLIYFSMLAIILKMFL